MASNRYYRKSTSITVSNFYEQYQLGKYRFDPPYQRDMNVWDIEQKSFLLDTIFKNFPIPPIFLEQKIDSDTGITNYDVIDGKQRLSSHLYALWYLALYINNNQINADDICDKMNIFYRNLRSDKTIPQTVIYQQSMQSASRSKSARKKRVNAILTYLEYEKL